MNTAGFVANNYRHSFRNCYCILTVGLILLLGTARAVAAPGGGGGGAGMGGGPACPPACPATPANCDANLILTQTQDLQFGMLVAPTAGTGTVTVDTAGLRTAGGGVVLITGGTVSAAAISMSTTPYNCTGRALALVSVASPAVLSGPGPNMSLDTFATTPITGDAFDPTIPLYIGGTLHVGAMQTPGAYSGFMLITVTFQ